MVTLASEAMFNSFIDVVVDNAESLRRHKIGHKLIQKLEKNYPQAADRLQSNKWAPPSYDPFNQHRNWASKNTKRRVSEYIPGTFHPKSYRKSSFNHTAYGWGYGGDYYKSGQDFY